MPGARSDRVAVSCPKCGHTQLEPPTAYSSLCKKCHAHFRLEDVLRPAAQAEKPHIAQKRVQCFQCGTELDVALAAASTMCKRCSSHVDLSDHRVTQTVSKNFRTYGDLMVEEKGYVLNSEALVRRAVIKGRFIGKLTTVDDLEVHTSCSIKGTLNPGRLVVPAGQRFGWLDPLRAKNVEVSGELVASVIASNAVYLRATARLFGNVEARHLIVESGAVFVGNAKVGLRASQAPGEFDDF